MSAPLVPIAFAATVVTCFAPEQNCAGSPLPPSRVHYAVVVMCRVSDAGPPAQSLATGD